MPSLVQATAVAAALGVGTVAYSAGYEVRAFRLREATIPCLPPGSTALRVLHLSDIHLTPSQHKKQRWLRRLAALQPDLIVNTGDNISHADSLGLLMRALGDLRDIPGVYVLGSNDYWGPVLKSPLRYFLPNGGRKRFQGPPLPWRELRAAFDGVDDPHLRYDKLSAVAGEADPSVDLRLGVAHAPYLRVLDAFTTDRYDAILAGHTHGGQLRVPGYGALVTNCDLEPRRSRGLHRHEAAGRQSWLHVSAGLGTSPYAPYRFCCYPEASLLTLTAQAA